MSGESRVDCHVKVLDERVVERAKDRGIDVLVYAPHFERLPVIRRRAAAFSDEDLLVVPGREVFTGSWRDRRHVLAVGLDEPVPDFITLEGALAAFERQDAAVLVPHPGFANVSLGREELDRHARSIHAVETYNPKQRAAGRDPASLAAESALRPFGSSYAHLRGTVGEVWTTFETTVDAESDLVAAIREGVPRRVCHREGLVHRARCAAELAHLGWENTWGKVERVLLSGMEATHPGHVAYDGRFDAVAVY